VVAAAVTQVREVLAAAWLVVTQLLQVAVLRLLAVLPMLLMVAVLLQE
jgi:hypothetical protein